MHGCGAVELRSPLVLVDFPRHGVGFTEQSVIWPAFGLGCLASLAGLSKAWFG